VDTERPGRSDAGPLDPLVGRTIARLGRHVELALSQVDLTIAQYRALVQLDVGAEAPTSLAAQLAVTKPSITAVVEGLLQRGLVDRTASVEDRRRISVYLTGEGRRVLALADQAVGDRLGDVLAEVDDPQAALAGLESWRQAIDAHRQRRRQQSQSARRPTTNG
jgi:long-chain acyl-CoA synthetase